ncbi:MAG: branched-chain amino acid ABC transporter permease [Desulfomonilia bacterium]|jgi:branched-chain amino acid transport system permease protein|uniref:Leucine/isoleucine/valine transporter permease subunit n=1 Tax=anaerobic digester metagenome TaxID=1263854 RepID=A0A485M3S0_9ZZZZ|nr:branched-chain amino acid ABC transporter permease [Pseudomonadota bacterium]HRS54822.1 branched-chain amino acid ABC transporter permease [Desulfomonilia bacterium]HRV34423.1 branched-chain amino acid ABC transporter permease [Desulfomonilia bacterium]
MRGKRNFVWAVGCILAIFLLGGPFILPNFWTWIIIEIMVMSLAAMSVNFLLGYAGCLSFGHSAFYAVAAYTTAIMMTRTGMNQYQVLLLAPIMAAILGALIGLLVSRLYAFYYAIMTCAFAMIVWSIIRRLPGLTGGDTGIVGIKFSGLLNGMTNIYYFTLVVVILCGLALWIIGNSPFGWSLRAIRENPDRSAFISIDVTKQRFLALVISSFFCGIAGSLHVVYSFGAFPELAFWTKSGDFVTICILGGINSFLGPIVGSVVLIMLETMITSVTLYWPMVLGIIICAVVFFMPEGIMGFVKKLGWEKVNELKT